MKKITPSEALSKMEGFSSRVSRIERNKYSDPRFRTRDLNRLRFEFKYVYLWHSIAFFNENKERAFNVIEKCREKYKTAYYLIEKAKLYD